MVGGKKKRNPEVTPKQEQIKFEEELRKMKLQLKRDELAKKNQDEGIYQASTNSVQTKLLELVITKFDGSYMDLAVILGSVFRDYRQNKRHPDHEVHLLERIG